MDLSSMTEAEVRAALDGKVLRGKDGWLFLDNDANQVLKQHTGEFRFSAEDLEHWRLLLETRAAWLARLGIPYFFVVAPNAHSVYPEKLPDDVTSVAPRPITQLIDHLASTSSYDNLLYPIEELTAGKARRLVYSQTDSHWTFFGAFLAFSRLLDEIGRTMPVRRLAEDELEWDEAVFTGGLGYKVEPEQSSTHPYVKWMPKRARLVEDNCILNNGSLMEFECDEAPEGRCLFLGDSFSVNPLLFMSEAFRHLTYGHTTRLDFELVRDRRPDVVVSLINERFMIKVPFDLPGKSVRQMAREKTEQGQIRTRMRWWEPPAGT